MHEPAALPVTVYVADGPCAFPDAAIAATFAQVSRSPNAPAYPVSPTTTLAAFDAPVPTSAIDDGAAVTIPGDADGLALG